MSAVAAYQSPRVRAWQRFRAHRRGWWSLWLFGCLFAVSLFAEVLSNDRPLLVPGQPEIREYKLRFWDAGQENGDWTDVASATVSL